MQDQQTLVIEDVAAEGRLRRPSDLRRLLIAVFALVAVAALSYFASNTTAAISSDLLQGANKLPSPLVFVANLISGLGALVLPGLAGVDLLLRRRGRQLVEAVGAMLAAVLLLWLATRVLVHLAPDRLFTAFTGTTRRENAVAFSTLLGALAAFVTVARLLSRGRWNVAAISVISTTALAEALNGGITSGGLASSILAGWAIGLAIRWGAGTETSRPSGAAIAQALGAAGHPLRVLRATAAIDTGRRYDAVRTDGTRLDVIVLDRDLDGSGLATSIYRSLRLRDDPSASGTSMRRRLERAALFSWAAGAAGVPTPRLLTACEIGPDAAALVYSHQGGRSLLQLGDGLGEAEVVGAWEALHELQAAELAHRALHADNIELGDDGKIYLVGADEGAIAASDVLQRIDTAELLCTLAVLAGAEPAIAAGRVVVGDETLAKAVPVLQPVAFSAQTRAALKAHPQILGELRERLLGLAPNAAAEVVEVERIKPRTVLTIAAGTVAAYLVMTMLASVDLVALVTSANPSWTLVALGASAATYFGAALTLHGSVPAPLSLWKSFQTQWAASFATLVAPPTLGSVAINARYLTRNKIPAALAATCVAVVQVFSIASHIVLLLFVVIAAGTTSEFHFRPPQQALTIVVALGLAAAISLTIPRVRAILLNRIGPAVSSVLPRVLSLASQPRKLAEGLGGMFILNVAYCLALGASLRAFDPKASLITAAVVYLAGSVVGAAAPTPGGLGAMEAALIAGLTAAGVDSGVAVSGTLLFRVATFWLPTLPGWLAFRNLQRTGDL